MSHGGIQAAPSAFHPSTVSPIEMSDSARRRADASSIPGISR